MAGQRNNHGKRSHSRSDHGDNGGSKRRNPGDEKEAYAPGPEDTVYRYLCQGRKIGSIIGRGGEIVKQLRADTHAKIRIGETVPGCEERVITIFSSSEECNTLEDSGETVCAAQDALFKVHERLISDDDGGDDDDDANAPQVTVRLLVPSDQIGCIIGKGGQIIQGIRSSTGAQIRILKNEYLPSCAISTDELLQIAGDASIVKKALFDVSSRLHENPSRSQHMLFSNVANSSHYGGFSSGTPVMGVGPLISQFGGYKSDAASDWPSFYPPPRDDTSTKEFELRMLCPAANIGGVIGKGGLVIKQIRQDSGAFIKVDSSNAEDDCIITISANELFEDPISATIDAAVRLQPRCSERTERESGEPSYTTRLLVSTTRIGCLIGKGGSIISEMRRSTRANIRILSKENLPKVALDDDEMVQISGDLDVAKDALVQITTRLKANFFEREDALSSFQPLPYRPMPSDVPDISKYGSRDSKGTGRGYSYSGRYGASGDLLPSGSYASSQGGSTYGTYGAHTGRAGSTGLSGPNPVSHGKHYGY
ncbi:KH domain-containing protein HEN4-like isoform X2 [Phalaenopsis equestris]|uniref:KH domain-containing protein HEN4-like isoform X2 n=1 Tax=Phalaenopsis equestris TaxID=78828 RepID=UPI0009E61CFD|nr:KH domain-containing protein HEN4-like isoform X2 [Phalaenopsis equestris]XP_020580842.1 KH domain-containing protein HEN4-like isoform X2 [Phalaenopsis equestris]